MKIFGKSANELGTIHFIGAGGIGMSGLMEGLHSAGFNVSGSDAAADDNANVTRLRDLGIDVMNGHDVSHVDGAAIVVVSTAITPNNVELIAAEGAGRDVIHRADMLAEIMQNFNTIAVTGTHGKTSTTALIYTALQAAGIDVGMVNGGVLTALKTNVILPKKPEGWLVVEADESDASFTKFKPDIGVITNIEAEHMDTFGDEEKLLAGFKTFLDNIKDIAVLCADDERVALLEGFAACDVVTYGFDEFADARCVGTPVPQGQGAAQSGMAFDALLRGGHLPDVVVNAVGVHNVQNALSALAIAQILNADVNKAATGLAEYAGVGRRFTLVGQFHGADVIDDYGHHPTEIAATLEAAKKVYPAGKVVAIVQPHRYTRLRDLMDDFASSVKIADAVVVLPVYAAGEPPLEGVDHTILAEKIRAALPKLPVIAADNEWMLAELLEPYAEDENCLLFLGAGDSGRMARELTT